MPLHHPAGGPPPRIGENHRNPPPPGEGDHAQHGGGAPGHLSGRRDTVKQARKLRSEMTLPESLLWSELRQRPGGFKFRRQHAAGDYILDFYCAAAKLTIKVDGWVHDTVLQARKDEARSCWLRSRGVATTRIPARLVMENKGAVVARVVQICRERLAASGERPVPLHHPADGPPPRSGEEFA
nr:DUF559 domain-containing protein [Croceibacterium ferulae]